jgi:hypothetical protein
MQTESNEAFPIIAERTSDAEATEIKMAVASVKSIRAETLSTIEC